MAEKKQETQAQTQARGFDMEALKKAWQSGVYNVRYDILAAPRYHLKPEFAAQEAANWQPRWFERRMVPQLTGGTETQGYKLVRKGDDYHGFPFDDMFVEEDWTPSGHIVSGEEICEDGQVRPDLYLAIRPRFIEDIVNKAITEHYSQLHDINKGPVGDPIHKMVEDSGTGDMIQVRSGNLTINGKTSVWGR